MWLNDLFGDIKRIEKDEAIKYIVGGILVYLWKRIKPILKSVGAVFAVLYVLVLLWLDDKGIVKMAEWKKQSIMLIMVIGVVLLLIDKLASQKPKSVKLARLQG